MRVLILAAAVFAAGPVLAQDAAKSTAPRDAADRFSLDLPPADEDAAVAAPAAPAADPSPAAEPLPGIPAAKPTLDTPIADLVADKRARRVLDRDLPGMSTDKNLDQFKHLSLRRLQPLSGGRLTPALLDKVAADFAAIE